MSDYELDGIRFCCAEQGMMHDKALLFGDIEIAELILKATSPRKIKALGRRVKGYDEETWINNRLDIVYRNNVAKFTADEKLRKFILNTEGIILVEASPLDAIWGIGLAEDSAKKCNSSEDWPGLNLLGQAFMRARKSIAGQEEIDSEIKVNVPDKSCLRSQSPATNSFWKMLQMVGQEIPNEFLKMHTFLYKLGLYPIKSYSHGLLHWSTIEKSLCTMSASSRTASALRESFRSGIPALAGEVGNVFKAFLAYLCWKWTRLSIDSIEGRIHLVDETCFLKITLVGMRLLGDRNDGESVADCDFVGKSSWNVTRFICGRIRALPLEPLLGVAV